ncbi:uncharacterized protein G2W53_001681 [Senna tora]|uniref:Uncharacterized protein n=1 Tax=Senna tora TaxID=362788 RepID=A0A834XJ49_9FABA|nr:uncharacterized protein G2W53_001681 [Senna tora]
MVEFSSEALTFSLLEFQERDQRQGRAFFIHVGRVPATMHDQRSLPQKEPCSFRTKIYSS